MKAFGRYLTYRMEKSALRTLIITVLSLITVISVISDCTRRTDQIKFNESGIYMLSILLGVLCTVIPMMETEGFKNRRNLDTLYFFPIDRWKLALAHYVSGLVQVLAVYTVTFVAAYGYLAVRTDYFALYHMFGYYFLSLLLGFVMYSFFIFIFGEANTNSDGVVFCVLWMFVITVVASTVGRIAVDGMGFEFLNKPTDTLYAWGTVYVPINNLTVIFQDLIEINRESDYYTRYAAKYIEQWYMFAVWVVIGIACAYGYFVSFVRKGAQKAGEISDSYFGYRTLIPIFGYSLLIDLGFVDILSVLVFVAMVIGYIIYRRSVKIKTVDIALTAGGIIAMIIGTLI